MIIRAYELDSVCSRVRLKISRDRSIFEPRANQCQTLGQTSDTEYGQNIGVFELTRYQGLAENIFLRERPRKFDVCDVRIERLWLTSVLSLSSSDPRRNVLTATRLPEEVPPSQKSDNAPMAWDHISSNGVPHKSYRTEFTSNHRLIAHHLDPASEIDQRASFRSTKKFCSLSQGGFVLGRSAAPC